MSSFKEQIKLLIVEEVERSLLSEQEDEGLDLGGDEGGGAEGGGEDAGTDDEGLDLGGGDEGGEDEGLDLGGDEGGGEDTGEDLGDIGGGDAGGGLSGGGGGDFDFGDEGDEGLEADEGEEGEEDTSSTVGPEDAEIPEDPVTTTVDAALEMLDETRDPQDILNAVKGTIQLYFQDFDDATPIIQKLWETEDVTLRDVAQRLLLFIRGTTI